MPPTNFAVSVTECVAVQAARRMALSGRTVNGAIFDRQDFMNHRLSWSEGVFVLQHHFQGLERYQEDLVRQNVQSLRRFHWGLSAIEIDDHLLASGQFGVRRLACTMPDGLVVRAGGPSGDSLPESRAVEPHFPADRSTLDVFVAVVAEGRANVGAYGAAPGRERYRRTVAPVEDFNGGDVQELEFLVPNLRIVFGSEPLDGLTALPIAQLSRRSDGRVIVRDRFVPPVLAISAAPFLTDGLRRLLGAMVSRQRELLGSRKQRSSTSIEFHASDARSFWLLHTLSAAVPLLRHLLESARVHPEELYLALAQLVGQLATFSAEQDGVPPFQFDRIGDVFDQLFARAVALLAVDSTTAYTEIALTRRADGMFVGRFDSRLANHEFFVAVRGTVPEPSVRERIPNLLKIAGWKQIGEVVKQARHGVTVEVDWDPSPALPVRPGLCFFRVHRDGAFWDEIAKTASIALYLPNDADWKDANVAVYAIERAHLQ